ncbi:hypothetical protein V6N13_009193 [Hibiscus sabdariffa]
MSILGFGFGGLLADKGSDYQPDVGGYYRQPPQEAAIDVGSESDKRRYPWVADKIEFNRWDTRGTQGSRAEVASGKGKKGVSQDDTRKPQYGEWMGIPEKRQIKNGKKETSIVYVNKKEKKVLCIGQSEGGETTNGKKPEKKTKTPTTAISVDDMNEKNDKYRESR